MNDLEVIGKRLQEFMTLKDIGINELGRMLGTSGSQVYNIINGKKYGTDKLLKVINCFPELNIDWLLRGEGTIEKASGKQGNPNGNLNGNPIPESQNERYIKDAGQNAEFNAGLDEKDKIKGTQNDAGGNDGLGKKKKRMGQIFHFKNIQSANPKEKTLQDEDLVKEINKTKILLTEDATIEDWEPYVKGKYIRPIVVAVDRQGRNNIFQIDAKAAAGLPTNYDNPHYFENLPSFNFPGEQYQQGSYIFLQATGDSMHPTIYHHDYLLAKFLENWYTIKDGQVGIVVTRAGVVVKRIFNKLKERKSIVLQSDNNKFNPPYEEKLEDIVQIWDVKAKLSFNLVNESRDIREDVDMLKTELFEIKKVLNRKSRIDDLLNDD